MDSQCVSKVFDISYVHVHNKNDVLYTDTSYKHEAVGCVWN